MTGKLTRSAREVIVDAMGRAHSDAAAEVREEHLLAAVITDPDMRPLLTKVGGLSDAAALLAEVKQSRRRAGVSPVETDALAQFGVDVDVLVARAEAELGEGALDDTGGRGRRGWGAPAISVAVRRALQGAQWQASARGDRDLGPEHLLLGLLAEPGLVADILGRRGVTVPTVLAALDAREWEGGGR